MPGGYQSLINAVAALDVEGTAGDSRNKILEDLGKLWGDFEKLRFRYERSNKEKNILSSLLTRTSTDLKKVSERLKARAEELSTILSTIPAYVYFKDNELRYILVNHFFAELAGKKEEEIQGKKVNEIFENYTNIKYIETETKVVETGIAVYDIEEELEYDNRKLWVSTNLAPIRDPSGMIVGLIGISWDITERKHYESELMHAKELAEAGTLAKNEFIASVSHEFRTPMNGVLGLAEMLRNTKLDESQTDLLNGIVSSADNLLVLVNDLLDFSAIEAGKMELDFHPFMLDRVMDDSLQMLKLKAHEKSLDFSFTLGNDVPLHITGDPKRLGQIIINLANNAVKFTEKGSVSVNVGLLKRTRETVLLRFEVRDTGIGIPTDSIDSLFKVFSRLTQKQHKLISGTGLGLSICKKLTQLMGGEIGVESELGKGSVFWFTLPFRHSEPVAVSQANEPALAVGSYLGRKVLVAEDNLINQKIAVFQLKRLGFEVSLAADGQSAMDLFSVGAFDLVILDIQMPVMDGYQVAKAIRIQEKDTPHHVPLIALTANAMKGDREIYLEAGMDGYVSKPFTIEILQQAIEQAEIVALRSRKIKERSSGAV